VGFLKELLVPVLFAGFLAVLYFDTADLPKESVLFPHILMVVMPVFAGLMLLTEYRQRKARSLLANSADGDAADAPRGWAFHARPMLVAGLTAGYLALFILTNFLIATSIFLVSSMLVFRVHWLKAAIIGVAFTGTLYAIFHFGFNIRI
jgi:hypothetical protein